MSVIAMLITSAEKHPNGDRLRVYTATDDTRDTTLTFVANLTNVYEVGDTVAVAQVGTVLPPSERGEDQAIPGLLIQATVIRKVESFGMGLGKTDKPVGTVLDVEFGVPPAGTV